MQKEPGKLQPFILLFIAIVVLVGGSLLPIEKLTNGKLRNYNLLQNIMVSQPDSTEIAISEISNIDPALVAIIETSKSDGTDLNSEERHSVQDTIFYAHSEIVDTTINPRVGDLVILEDYTIDGTGLKYLKKAIENKETLNRPIRIAFLGDSYIEGDIFSQHIRQELQDLYGGSGVGYVNLHSEFPGFRRSVKQSGSGWTTHDFLKNNVSNKYLTISQQYFNSSTNANATYKGTKYVRHIDKWNSSKFLFICQDSTTISTKVGAEWINHSVAGSDSVQCINISIPTEEFSVKTSSESLIGLGVWLEDNHGITVDCMSTRGSSGITLTRVNKNLSHQLSQYIQYDLIILEYGINAMTAGQTNFNAYTAHMGKVIEHLRNCYPNTDIILMGIGDRGEKRGSEVHSMRNVPIMVNAQRQLAKRMQCVFWDTREAMGGEDAAVKWTNHTPAYVNKDYIHLSYKGGEVLASEFVKSLTHAINE